MGPCGKQHPETRKTCEMHKYHARYHAYWDKAKKMWVEWF